MGAALKGCKPKTKQLLFGIVQGSSYLDLRKNALAPTGIGFDGYS